MVTRRELLLTPHPSGNQPDVGWGRLMDEGGVSSQLLSPEFAARCCSVTVGAHTACITPHSPAVCGLRAWPGSAGSILISICMPRLTADTLQGVDVLRRSHMRHFRPPKSVQESRCGPRFPPVFLCTRVAQFKHLALIYSGIQQPKQRYKCIKLTLFNGSS